MKRYIALIGDLINSKKIENRKIFQENLRTKFEKINQDFSDIIASNFTITIGDEFQALLKLDKDVVFLLDRLYSDIQYDFRIGIGLGEISTKIDPKISIGADGQAFWRAREAIEYVHSNNFNGRCNIFFISGEKNKDEIINNIFMLTESLKWQWTDLQKSTFIEMIDSNIFNESFNQQDFANKLGISQSSLSKRLTAGNIKIYIRGRLQIGRLLEEFYD